MNDNRRNSVIKRIQYPLHLLSSHDFTANGNRRWRWRLHCLPRGEQEKYHNLRRPKILDVELTHSIPSVEATGKVHLRIIWLIV